MRLKYLEDSAKNEENLKVLMASIKTTRATPTSRIITPSKIESVKVIEP
jgi:hypothetical protein